MQLEFCLLHTFLIFRISSYVRNRTPLSGTKCVLCHPPPTTYPYHSVLYPSTTSHSLCGFPQPTAQLLLLDTVSVDVRGGKHVSNTQTERWWWWVGFLGKWCSFALFFLTDPSLPAWHIFLSFVLSRDLVQRLPEWNHLVCRSPAFRYICVLSKHDVVTSVDLKWFQNLLWKMIFLILRSNWMSHIQNQFEMWISTFLWPHVVHEFAELLWNCQHHLFTVMLAFIWKK